MKIAVLFPGIGYTCDKPLMYYAGKLAAQRGYKVIPVAYRGFPDNVKGDPVKMRRALEIACEQAGDILADLDMNACDDVLFIGKSIGTLVAARYARQRDIPARSILFTPLAETFCFTRGEAIAFHGTADPWADTDAIIGACREQDIPLCLTEGANHSLETGNVETDLKTLVETLERVGQFINGVRP